MPRYGVTTDYEYNADHPKRDRLQVWSGAWFHDHEGTALSLPSGRGYTITDYNGKRFRVTCPTPRTEENYQQVDDAIAAAMNAYNGEST